MSAIAGGVDGEPTHVLASARIRGVLDKRADVGEAIPQDLDPLHRSLDLV